jgi:hypothetical protein
VLALLLEHVWLAVDLVLAVTASCVPARVPVRCLRLIAQLLEPQPDALRCALAHVNSQRCPLDRYTLHSHLVWLDSGALPVVLHHATRAVAGPFIMISVAALAALRAVAMPAECECIDRLQAYARSDLHDSSQSDGESE